jgi:uroporphyrinogen decarboxylase
MTKLERVRATLAGRPVDRPPVTVWYHFGTQHAAAERTAQVHLEFFEHYDLDLLKVMNDYDYPMPAGLDIVAGPEDLRRLEPWEPAATPFGEQLKAIERIATALRGKALFVDTVFNAWNTLRRNLAREAMGTLMERHPEPLEAALRVVNQNLIRYATASLQRGAAGIFLAVPASEESVTRDQYERFMRPFDLELLNAVKDRAEMNVLHAHGERLYLDRLLEYPAQVLSWADLNGGPSIADMRPRTALTLMAGVDHERFAQVSPLILRRQVQSARAQAGASRFILAPGCSVPTYSFPPLIAAIRDAASE